MLLLSLTVDPNQNRLALQSFTTITISSLSSLIVHLTASSASSESESESRPNARSRLDLIDNFRESFLLGEFMRERASVLSLDEVGDERFSDGGGGSSVYSFLSSEVSELELELESSGGGGRGRRREPALPLSAVQQGIQAEKTIKSHLKKQRSLLSHENFKSLPAAARRCMARCLSWRKPIYLECGLVKSPGWVKEYEERGWAPPGIRWGNFKPDLVKFSKKEGGSKTDEEGQVVWEVIEIKWSANKKETVGPPSYLPFFLPSSVLTPPQRRSTPTTSSKQSTTT